MKCCKSGSCTTGPGISSKLRDRHPGVPWAQIVALRNILVHEYFVLDLDQVWTMVERDLPKLQGQIQSILSQEEPGAK